MLSDTSKRLEVGDQVMAHIRNGGSGTCRDGIRATKWSLTGRASGNMRLLVTHGSCVGPGDVVICDDEG